MLAQNQYKIYRLPCGMTMNGTQGNQRSFSKRFELHRNYCEHCVKITVKDFNNKLSSHHYSSTRHYVTPQSLIESNLKYY